MHLRTYTSFLFVLKPFSRRKSQHYDAAHDVNLPWRLQIRFNVKAMRRSSRVCLAKPEGGLILFVSIAHQCSDHLELNFKRQPFKIPNRCRDRACRVVECVKQYIAPCTSFTSCLPVPRYRSEAWPSCGNVLGELTRLNITCQSNPRCMGW